MKNLIKEGKARIVQHRKLAEKIFSLRLFFPEIARLAQPGQFIMLRVGEGRDPFLRRPFSLARIFPPYAEKRDKKEKGLLEIWYQVRGRGTYLMTQLREGERVDVLGPLGKGFWLEENLKKAILVGGGIGIAPLVAWAEKIIKEKSEKRIADNNREILVLIGGKSKEKILGRKEFKKMGIEPKVTTEDNSLGSLGLVTDLLEAELMTGRNEFTTIYACGPWSMLAKVAQIAEQFDLPCQVLLEARMACAMGACLGCVVKVRAEDETALKSVNLAAVAPERSLEEEKEEFPEADVPLAFRYARVCQEGPVFPAQKIIWE